jgi:Plasmid encoded RepA protein
MGQVHDILEAEGKQAALRADIARQVVEAASLYMGDEEGGIGFLYSGWCQAALPHKRLPDDTSWEIKSERIALVVEPGRRRDAVGDFVSVGVPYGSRARLIMLYLQSEALRTGSRDVMLGRSLRDWLVRMGISVGGKSLKDVREQADRIARCRFTFHVNAGNRAGLVNQNVVDTAMFIQGDDAGQGSLFVEVARLSEVFFEQLKKHPVPIEEAAIRALSNNSQALDIYAWLAYRLHVLEKSTPVSWPALKGQFGISYARLDHFRTYFVDNLKLALAVYRKARVDLDFERGLVLHPSPAPVASRIVAGTALPSVDSSARRPSRRRLPARPA